MDQCEILGHLFNNWKTARSEGTISISTPYHPVISKGIGPVRTVYCQDPDGKRIESIGGVEIKIDLDDKKGANEEKALEALVAAQVLDAAEWMKRDDAARAKAAELAAEPPYTWQEKLSDAFGGVLLGLILWFAANIDWAILWHKQLGF